MKVLKRLNKTQAASKVDQQDSLTWWKNNKKDAEKLVAKPFETLIKSLSSKAEVEDHSIRGIADASIYYILNDLKLDNVPLYIGVHLPVGNAMIRYMGPDRYAASLTSTPFEYSSEDGSKYADSYEFLAAVSRAKPALFSKAFNDFVKALKDFVKKNYKG